MSFWMGIRFVRLILIALIVGALPAVRDVEAQDSKPEQDEAKSTTTDTAGSKEQEELQPGPKVVVFRLKGSLKETPSEDISLFGSGGGVALKDLVERMDKAAKDPAVKAVVLLPDGVSVGQAQIEEIRQAMRRLQQAGKPVHVHADGLTMTDFVLFSGASRLSAVPTADLWITGYYAEAPYLRGLLEKLDIQPDFLTCGDYKSAGEIFMRKEPSPEARAMENWILDSLYESSIELIAEGRKVDAEKVREWIDAGPYTSETACEKGLIDAVEHRQDVEARLRSEYGNEVVFDGKYGKKEEPKPDFSTPFGLFRFLGEMMGGGSKPKVDEKKTIAIVYVEGPIVLSEDDTMSLLGGGTSAVAGRIRHALNEAAEDDSVKAVVLRVDSPGGSAVASEIILDATRRVKAKKPLVVSMGNVAGSGGYYVAMGSDTIYADKMTITASIGVVAGKLATEGLFDRIGIHFEPYQRGENADLMASDEVWTEEEKTRIQSWMNDIYQVFKGHVTRNRGDKLTKPLEELAGGRVYTGAQALELGLIDKIGTLHDAVADVAVQASLGEDYEIRVIPKPRSFLEQLLEDDGGEEGRNRLDVADEVAPRVRRPASPLLELAAPLLRMLDSRRSEIVRGALGRLELLHREGVLLLMPETRFGR